MCILLSINDIQKVMFHSDDLVYVEEEDLLNEYILNDSGCIFRGNKRQVSLKPWNFGQVRVLLCEI